jgi:DnaJ-class molecular chaperone
MALARGDLHDSLGVWRLDPTAAIRAAHHDLRGRFFAATDHASRFMRGVDDAVETLVDVRLRSRYDRQLGRFEERGELGSEAEPMRAGDEPARVSSDEVRLDLLRDFAGASPSREEVRDSFRANFLADAAPKSGRVDTLELQIGGYAEGTSLALAVPAFHPCTTCHGTGRLDVYRCQDCDGSGLAEERVEIHVAALSLEAARGEVVIHLGRLGIRSPIVMLRVVSSSH